jgi:hypothetical protein
VGPPGEEKQVRLRLPQPLLRQLIAGEHTLRERLERLADRGRSIRAGIDHETAESIPIPSDHAGYLETDALRREETDSELFVITRHARGHPRSRVRLA